jgi:splicing factor U2AF subunit
MSYLPSMIPNMAHLAPLSMNPQQDKINRELFVGNTPPGTSEILLQHFVNAAMRRVGLCQPHESPVLSARVNQKFAFVELDSIENANKCMNLNGIPFLTAFLKISRPSKYTGPNTNAVTWQQLTGQNVTPIIDPEQQKLQRELFIGNTTPEMTADYLKEFIGNAMLQVGLADPKYGPGNPILSCRVSGKFAFVEVRSAEEAAAALNLNNIPCMGTALRVGRPSKYTGPPDQHGNWEDILAKYLSGDLQAPGAAGATTNTTATAPSSAASLMPSRIVELQHTLTLEDLSNDDEIQDIIEDTEEQCKQFGNLKSVIIPRANEPGATKIFLEYASVADAANAIRGLEGRTFDGRLVEANYFDEARFANRDYA